MIYLNQFITIILIIFTIISPVKKICKKIMGDKQSKVDKPLQNKTYKGCKDKF